LCFNFKLWSTDCVCVGSTHTNKTSEASTTSCGSSWIEIREGNLSRSAADLDWERRVTEMCFIFIELVVVVVECFWDAVANPLAMADAIVPHPKKPIERELVSSSSLPLSLLTEAEDVVFVPRDVTDVDGAMIFLDIAVVLGKQLERKGKSSTSTLMRW